MADNFSLFPEKFRSKTAWIFPISLRCIINSTRQAEPAGCGACHILSCIDTFPAFLFGPTDLFFIVLTYEILQRRYVVTAIIVDRDLCNSCGICSEVCPLGVIVTEEGKGPEVRPEREAYCIQCGHCEACCPESALVLDIGERELPLGEGTTLPADLVGHYMKNRRSVRHYKKERVPRETIRAILDVARYAPSGSNSQPVEWLVVHDPGKVRELAASTIDWMRFEATKETPVMPATFLQGLIASWEKGHDPICRGAPHLLVAHVPEGPGSGPIDAIIALTYADLAAPAFGVGTCWAGFLSMAVPAWKPLRDALALPKGRTYSYALMCGYPRFRSYRIPPRKPLRVSWQ
jgi:nitroreductase/NAD-dependent dihydropyrimidine dehydrogenase PreA subunit